MIVVFFFHSNTCLAPSIYAKDYERLQDYKNELILVLTLVADTKTNKCNTN